jgi:hypothetical protein
MRQNGGTFESGGNAARGSQKTRESSLLAKTLTSVAERLRLAFSESERDLGVLSFHCNLVSLQMDYRSILYQLLDLPVAGL